ncbi:hypothetical protein LNP18_06290 [Leuconostoc citreum]|uniref:hypothetical protein n=1 Tax=Leuconostoc citreum TaxID=33964 RepID=UPI00200AA2D2|nr:hypothetical protein [Leuconostoc citreum]MCK8605712.1 hypothetical protein [Leuconostoc citreum]
MRSKQLSLFDLDNVVSPSPCLETMVLVRKLSDDGLSDKRLRAVITHTGDTKCITNIIFLDADGQQYVGCRYIYDVSKKQYNQYLHLTKTEDVLNIKLKIKIDAVKQLIEEKREKYYAN